MCWKTKEKWKNFHKKQGKQKRKAEEGHKINIWRQEYLTHGWYLRILTLFLVWNCIIYYGWWIDCNETFLSTLLVAFSPNSQIGLIHCRIPLKSMYFSVTGYFEIKYKSTIEIDVLFLFSPRMREKAIVERGDEGEGSDPISPIPMRIGSSYLHFDPYSIWQMTTLCCVRCSFLSFLWQEWIWLGLKIQSGLRSQALIIRRDWIPEHPSALE